MFYVCTHKHTHTHNGVDLGFSKRWGVVFFSRQIKKFLWLHFADDDDNNVEFVHVGINM